MARVQLYYDGIGEVMRLPKVRGALAAQANGISGRARAISQAEGVPAAIRTETGTRPRGRPYARTLSNAAGAEFGSSNTKRRRVLARAAGI